MLSNTYRCERICGRRHLLQLERSLQCSRLWRRIVVPRALLFVQRKMVAIVSELAADDAKVRASRGSFIRQGGHEILLCCFGQVQIPLQLRQENRAQSTRADETPKHWRRKIKKRGVFFFKVSILFSTVRLDAVVEVSSCQSFGSPNEEVENEQSQCAAELQMQRGVSCNALGRARLSWTGQ